MQKPERSPFLPRTATSNYSIAFVIGTLTVTAAPLTVTANNASKVYGQANPAFAASYSGFVNGDTGASLGGTLVFSTPATPASPAGSYAITPSGLTSSNYTITFVTGTLTVTPAPLTITAVNQSMVYGGALPIMTTSYSGFVNGDTAASLTMQPTLSTAATTSSPVGSYVISAGGASSTNYTVTFVKGSLTITPDSTTTSLQTSAAAVLFGQQITLTATVSPGTSSPDAETGSVVFLDQGTPLATVPLRVGTAAFTTSSLPLGRHSLTAAYAGDTNHTASSSTVVVTIGTPNDRFVGQLYLSLLLRQADAGGLASCTTLLNEGVSRTQVALLIEQSQEWRTDQVQALYQQFLHRNADPDGLNTYVTFLGTGRTVEQVETFLTSSPEYLQVRGGGTNDRFLTALYQDALNRSPDTGGLAAFTQALNLGAGRQQVVAAIFGSPEYLRDLVTNSYEQFLKRAADAGGLNSFVESLTAGVSDQEVIAVMLGSDEFFANG